MTLVSLCVTGGGGRRVERCQNRGKCSEFLLLFIFVCDCVLKSFEEDSLHYFYRKVKPQLSRVGPALLHSAMNGCWSPGLRFLSLVGANFVSFYFFLSIVSFYCYFFSTLSHFIANPQTSACLGRTSSRTG